MRRSKQRKVSKIRTNYYDDYQEQENRNNLQRKKLRRRLLMMSLFAVGITYFLISSLLSQAATLQDKESEKAELEGRLVQLDNERLELEEEIVKLNNDEYLAKLARRDYFLSGDGEIIFNLPEKSTEDDSEDQEDE